MRWLAAAIATSMACGRIGFDPLGEGAAADSGLSGGDDAAAAIGDGAAADGAGALLDAAATACDSAIPVEVGVPILMDTCDGEDLIDGCTPAKKVRELLFEFVVPADGSYSFRARDPGTENVSNSTGIVDETCTATTTCAGILGRGLSQGEVVYLAVEASSGGCVTIEFDVRSGL